MVELITNLLELAPYSLEQNVKEKLLLEGLNNLTKFHYKNCIPYRNIINGAYKSQTSFEGINEIPYLPVGLFKKHKIISIPESQICLTLTSSGTTGQRLSHISIDKDTSLLQQKALYHSLKFILGTKRLPMLIIDTEDTIKNEKMISARGAGILGMMKYGIKHQFALTKDLKPDISSIKKFFKEVGREPFIIFGFTFVIWLYFFKLLTKSSIDLSKAIMIHSGGWKNLSEYQVDNETFRRQLTDKFGIRQIYNFYGMVEQIGTIFLEGPNGLLYAPNFADIIIRDPVSWKPSNIGEKGLIQVLSLLPISYPGHSLLTEDIGMLVNVDTNTTDWKGKGIKVLGRLPKSELRGCSDTLSMGNR
jgi:hypothetical protein